jgi:hypothetical protein
VFGLGFSKKWNYMPKATTLNGGRVGLRVFYPRKGPMEGAFMADFPDNP